MRNMVILLESVWEQKLSKNWLSEVDVNKELEEIQKELDGATGQKRTKLVKRLEVINAFVQSGNRPEWMIIEALPVIPPELRPMIHLMVVDLLLVI